MYHQSIRSVSLKISKLQLKMRCAIIVFFNIVCLSEQIKFKNLQLYSPIAVKPEFLPSGQCKEDILRFLNELQRGTLWAVQMFDASSKYPDGILYGNTRHLGNFDECYNLRVETERKNAEIGKIIGKYCLVDLLYEKKEHTLTTFNTSVLFDFDPNESVWKAIQEKGNFLRIPRNHIQLAICVPSSCMAEEIETALRKHQKLINANNDIEIYTTVQSRFCQTIEEGPKFTSSAKIYCFILLGWLSLIVGGTWYDIEFITKKEQISTFQNVILYFSAQRNFKAIFQMNDSHPELKGLYIIRLIFSVFLIYLHYSMRYFATPTINLAHFEKISTVPINMSFINGSILSDFFFTMGGLLLAHSLLRTLDQKKRFNFINNVLSRYLRLTPTYAVILFFFVWIFPLLGSGPFWKRIVEEEASICATNWWANLLYIHNYTPPKLVWFGNFYLKYGRNSGVSSCMYHTWYLSVDFHLFILSQFVVYVFWRMPRKIGYIFLTILTIIGSIIPSVVKYSYGSAPIFRVTPMSHHIQEISYFKTYYIKTHMRSSAYLVGIITGAVLHDHKQIKWQVPKFWLHVLVFPLPVTLYTIFQIWSFKFFIPYGDTSILEDAIYAFFYRLIPPLCLCIIIITLSVSSQHRECYTSFIKTVSSRWVQVLSRLTFGVYLINELIHIFSNGQVRTARVFSFTAVLWWDILPVAIYAFGISLFLIVCVEEPFRRLAKQIFPN